MKEREERRKGGADSGVLPLAEGGKYNCCNCLFEPAEKRTSVLSQDPRLHWLGKKEAPAASA